MLDDMDRECCSTIESIIETGLENHRHVLPPTWKIIKRTFQDPGITLVLEYVGPTHTLGQPKVTVKISWGDKSV